MAREAAGRAAIQLCAMGLLVTCTSESPPPDEVQPLPVRPQLKRDALSIDAPVRAKEARLPISVTTATGPVQRIPGPPLVPSPREFNLVASRNGEIEIHRDPSNAASQSRTILVATIPFPVDERGRINPLPGVFEGLTKTWDLRDVRIAGGFSGPNDGWLLLDHRDVKGHQLALPHAHEWMGANWRRLPRGRQGRFTEIPEVIVVRGDTVFMWIEHWKLDRPDAKGVEVEFGEHERHAGPPGRFVRIRGDEPEPRGFFLDAPRDVSLVDGYLYYHDYHRESHGAPHEWAWASTATDERGSLHRIVVTAEEDGESGGEPTYRGVLHTWAPGEASAREVQIPDIVAQPTRTKLRVTTMGDDVAISGNHQITGYEGAIAYLAVGKPEALRRIPLEFEGKACTGELKSVALGPDANYWMILDDGLHVLEPSGTLRRFEVPDLREIEPPLDLRGWAWDRCWKFDEDDILGQIRENPALPRGIDRIGDDLWLRMYVSGRSDVYAVYKTGAHVQPVVLPGEAWVLGETRRSNAGWWSEYRLLDDVGSRQIEAFEAELLPRMRSRSEILQIYESWHEGKIGIVAVIEPDEWRDEFVPAYTALLGRQPEQLQEPDEIRRMIFDRHQ